MTLTAVSRLHERIDEEEEGDFLETILVTIGDYFTADIQSHVSEPHMQTLVPPPHFFLSTV